MFDECVIRGVKFAPARFLAPLAGYTHSAFRRFIAEMGGCGAIWTEMLAARKILHEDFAKSPWLRRRPEEGLVFFQLMACEGDPLDRVLPRLGEHGVQAVDINLACNAPKIRKQDSGSALFENFPALRSVVTSARQNWPGILTAKIRLGSTAPGWEARFTERVHFLEEAGVDALILHPRFFEDKFRRRVRHELIPWAASLTKLPLIANGDHIHRKQVESLAEHLRPACAVMIGRMAVVRPWIFASWDHPMEINYGEIWNKMRRYIEEDFSPQDALVRLKMFTNYFSANFSFRHLFYFSVANAPTLEEAARRADEFMSRNPTTVSEPALSGMCS